MKSEILPPVLITLLAFAGLACAPPSSQVQVPVDTYKDEIQRLHDRILNNPSDTDAVRDFGVVLFKKGEFSKAVKVLDQVDLRAQNDGRTLFYLGMSHESLRQFKEARLSYREFVNVRTTDPFRKLLEGRSYQLGREIATLEIQRMIEKGTQTVAGNGATPDSPTPAPTAIAVFSLTYYGDDMQYAALGRGLSQLIMLDLAKVQELKLIDRARILALVKELNLNRKGIFSAENVPAFGRLLGAGRVIGGAFTLLDENFLLRIADWDIAAKKLPPARDLRQPITNIYVLQKQLVYDILRNLNIQLTAEEQKNIEQTFTMNFQALLAYSQALEFEDSARYEEAVRRYRVALAHDPQFELAAQHAARAECMSEAGGYRAAALRRAVEIERRTTPPNVGIGAN